MDIAAGAVAHRLGADPTALASSRLVEALTEYRGTVTEFLEDLVGEDLHADKLAQEPTTATSAQRFGFDDGVLVTRRATLLRGRQSSRAYLYAESLLMTSRLPLALTHALATTAHPIGRVIVEQGLAVTRVELGTVPQPSMPGYPREVDSCLYARECRLDLEGRPVMGLSEWFLADLAAFVLRDCPPVSRRESP